MRRLFTAALFLLVSSNTLAADRTEGRLDATRSVVHARHGMVAAAHPLAVEIGLDVLKAGGNAVDAAIATNAALTLLEPCSCGMGGDLFAMVWDPKTETLYGLNASGRSPAGLTRDMVPAEKNGTIPVYSPWAWSVPGCVDGWYELHGKFGGTPMAKLLQPTIDAAREGTPVPQIIAAAWQRSARVFGEKPGFAEVFLPGGQAPREGEIFANPALAATLEKLATGGRDAFYRGSIAKTIDSYSKKHGGLLRFEDLATHRSEWVEPQSTIYRGATVWELPPNGQGIAALQMLNILENYDLKALGRSDPDFWHLLIEAKKLAFADRARYYADPAFSNLPIDALLDKEYARQRADGIDMTRAAREVDPGNPHLDHGDTTFLVTADASGMMVSLIQSNYTGFGSGYVVPELGFGIQNRGCLFTLEEGHPNALEPGKRPFHTIIPAFFGSASVPEVAFGVMGGSMQPQGHAQIVINVVDFDMNLQEAGDTARFRHVGSSQPTGTTMTNGGTVYLESDVPYEVSRELVRRGHTVSDSNGSFGGYQAIRRDPNTGVLSGATESRKDGCAAGY